MLAHPGVCHFLRPGPATLSGHVGGMLFSSRAVGSLGNCEVVLGMLGHGAWH